jgi:hypothetical protein
MYLAISLEKSTFISLDTEYDSVRSYSTPFFTCEEDVQCWNFRTIYTQQFAEKSKVAAVERRASARALTLARSRGSEAAECLRSPEPALPELEIS